VVFCSPLLSAARGCSRLLAAAHCSSLLLCAVRGCSLLRSAAVRCSLLLSAPLDWGEGSSDCVKDDERGASSEAVFRVGCQVREEWVQVECVAEP